MRHQCSDRTTAYAQAVLAGRIIAGKPVRQACERHLNDLKSGHERGLKFDVATANRVIRFFEEFLILPETDGQRFILDPHQCFIVGSIFGWKRADGYRRFRQAYIEMGKGNGKSPLAGGIGIVGLVADGEVGAQIFSAAVNKDQAKILWSDAEKMVQSSPELRAVVKRNVNNLSVQESGSYFRPVSAEKRGLDGKRVHMALIDELHEHPNSQVVDKMIAGTKGRKQSLIFEITNSGFNRESVCWHHHDYSLRILEGNAHNDEWFAYVCQLDEKDEWTDPKVWIKANPNLGNSIPESYLASQVKMALDVPAMENIVKRLNFCIWTEQATRAVSMDQWDAGKDQIEYDPAEECYAALDAASNRDKASFVIVFPKREKKPWRVLPFYWVPRKTVEERARRGDTTWAQWEKEGHLFVTEGNIIDFDAIRRKISGVYFENGEQKFDDDCFIRKFNIVEMPKDPWNTVHIGTQLMNDGLNVTEFPQTMNHYTGPTKELLDALAAENIKHGGHPVLRSDAASLAVRQDSNGNQKPDREASGGSIDGIVCVLMGMGKSMLAESMPSAYDQGADLFL